MSYITGGLPCFLVVCTYFFLNWNAVLIHGKFVTGKIASADNWVFITRFCFLSSDGQLNFKFNFPIEFEPINLLLYFDDQWPNVYKTEKTNGTTPKILLYFDDQWPSVYKVADKTCLQREAILNPENNQVIYLTATEGWTGCVPDNTNSMMNCEAARGFKSMRERWWYVVASTCPDVMSCNEKTNPPYINEDNNQVIRLATTSRSCNRLPDGLLKCEDYRNFQSARERWWFIVVSRCNPTNNRTGLRLNYEILMTNGPAEDLFHRQFSADEFYILEVDISFLLAISVLCVMSLFVAAQLRAKCLFHSTYKLFMVALFSEFIHLLIMCISYGKYANDGLDNTASKTAGQVFEAISILVFLLMLILLGKGFTVTRGRISKSGSIKIAVFMTLFVIAYIVLFIYQAAIFDPGLVLYLYQSPAGYGLLVMRLIAWIWFCYGIFFTLKNYPEKSRFYYPFFIFFTLWFWADPIAILAANNALYPWVREKVANGIFCAINFSGLLAFLILTLPCHANSNFPYHVKTTQIAAMPDPDREQWAEFTHEAPPTNGGQYNEPIFTDIFTVSTVPRIRTRQNTTYDDTIQNTTYDTIGTLGKFPHEESAAFERVETNGNLGKFSAKGSAEASTNFGTNGVLGMFQTVKARPSREDETPKQDPFVTSILSSN